MPEMKNNFQRGRMNKDLDERLVPNGEYRDALNVEVSTSNESDIGTLQTIKGNVFLPGQLQSGVCIGSIANDRTNKLYFMVAGEERDIIVEYNYTDESFTPVCVDNHAATGVRALNFNADYLITGINIIEDLLFWTDNNSEPKRINITRGKAGSPNWSTHTSLMVRDTSLNAAPNALVDSGKPIEEEHLTVIRKGPPAPVLEMIDAARGDQDGDNDRGGDELTRELAGIGLNGNLDTWINIDTGELAEQIIIKVASDPDGDTGYQRGTDFLAGDYIIVYAWDDPTVRVRLKVLSGGSVGYTCSIESGDIEITDYERWVATLERPDSLFQFKFVRFACRYKYEDGEYSAFSPFTQPAFLPGKFNYVPKEGYNLGMLNNVRRLAVKDFVHDRQISDNVIAIDILYKESNSANVYSVKTIKRRDYNPNKWDEWNAISKDTVSNPSNIDFWEGTKGRVKGYMPIDSEMIHATLPANQLLRPWDNVPRKALAQEVIGNRLVYGNYLQNYNLENLDLTPGDSNIKVDVKVSIDSRNIGGTLPEEVHAGLLDHIDYNPAKSIKSLRTYQLGVVYLDKYGRETPVFSEDKRGSVLNLNQIAPTESSIYVEKSKAPKRNSLLAKMENNPPDWATHMKFFVKETSNEYYNLCMDRWYEAEDGNIWLSFPSADRNKVDEETFIILKKEHDNSEFVNEPGRYKIIAIENEAPRFIKLQNISMGGITDFENTGASPPHYQIGPNGNGFPGPAGSGLHSFQINIHADAFEDAGWKESLINQDISQCFFRVKGAGVGTSKYYRLKQVTFDGGDGTYVLKSAKQFGNDMDFTSADGTYFTRNKGLEVEVMKKIPEDRAEFDGRFFVKILKDDTLIARLGIVSGSTTNLVTTSSMRIQYINPKAIQSDWGGWDGYGTDPMKISLDNRMSTHWFEPPSYAGGDGDNFWKMAGDDESVESDSASSGWFIDGVEAFRPLKGQVRKFVSNKDDNVKWTAGQSCSGRNCDYISSWNNPIGRLLQVTGLDTYDDGNGRPYLDMDIYGPGRDGDFMRDHHDVSRSLAIDPSIGLIHLSYSGLNETAGGGSYAGKDDYTNDDWDFKQGPKHGVDITFITKLLKPGTLFTFKEDPGQVLYKTITPGAANTNSKYTAVNTNREQQDRDGGKGVFLYNYSLFNDYLITDHHNANVDNFWCGPWTVWFTDFASRSIGNHGWSCGEFLLYYASITTYHVSLWAHGGTPGAGSWDSDDLLGQLGGWDDHKRFPNGVHHWKTCYNRRRRFAIFAEVADGGGALGSVGPHYYLPTNDPNLPAHFDATANPITAFPTGHAQAGTSFESLGAAGKAPGVRPDGMYSGYNDHPGGPYEFDLGDGNGMIEIDQIPQYKRWDANNTENGGAPRQSGDPGSFTIEIKEQFEEDSEKFTSTNPAIWETEPKEDVGLDIYHEVGQIYPIYLNDETIEQFVGPVHFDISKNSFVECFDPSYLPGGGTGTTVLDIPQYQGTAITDVPTTDVRVLAVKGNYVRLGIPQSPSVMIAQEIPMDSNDSTHVTPPLGSLLRFHRADGSRTEAHVGPDTYNVPGEGDWYELVGDYTTSEVGVHNKEIRLPWFNCYSFGNGVESDRIRDDFNQVTIDNGPKASTTLEEPYLEERRTNGFIWSGLYNSTSGVNDLNQFIAAEKITKDSNPSYGSIQKLHARDSDLVAICEDRVLKVLANKDALFNADGNQNLVSTDRVLGNIRPFIGDYGISTNPESFAFDSYRAYWADSSRGAILRLSQDGITPISDIGMKDWFADHLSKNGDHNIIGSFDDLKGEYNITLQSMFADDFTCVPPSIVQYIYGCTDPSAINYNPQATNNDGSCTYPPVVVSGCTDPLALNYNSNANVDDGSCTYPPPPIQCNADCGIKYRVPDSAKTYITSEECYHVFGFALPWLGSSGTGAGSPGTVIEDPNGGTPIHVLMMSVKEDDISWQVGANDYLRNLFNGGQITVPGVPGGNYSPPPVGTTWHIDGSPLALATAGLVYTLNGPFGSASVGYVTYMGTTPGVWINSAGNWARYRPLNTVPSSVMEVYGPHILSSGPTTVNGGPAAPALYNKLDGLWGQNLTLVNNTHPLQAGVAYDFTNYSLVPPIFDFSTWDSNVPGIGNMPITPLFGTYHGTSAGTTMTGCDNSGVITNTNGPWTNPAPSPIASPLPMSLRDIPSYGNDIPYVSGPTNIGEPSRPTGTDQPPGPTTIEPRIFIPSTREEIGYTGGGVKGTLSFSEDTKGWVSFKSWNHENGLSLNNSYYTFNQGQMYQHHINDVHNNFYGTQFESSVDVLLNQLPSVIKSYSTFNYEGSQARITPGINNNPDYYDNLPKDGWYIDSAYSNAQELGILEFWDKEDKWFAQVQGVATQWLNDGTAGNIDPREFSFQGIGNAKVNCLDCPDTVTWNCIVGESGCECESVIGKGGEFISLEECESSNTCCNKSKESYSCCDGVCVDPGDGTGQYSSYCDCVNNSRCCDEGVAYMYTCAGVTPPSNYVFGCMDDGTTTDPFIIQQRPLGWFGPATTYDPNANVHSCDCVYAIRESWDCENDGTCIERFDGSGQYPTEADCINDCTAVVSPCEGQNLAFEKDVVNPMAMQTSFGGPPCLEETTVDGSVRVKMTDQNSSTPVTTWTMDIYSPDWSSGNPQIGNLLFDDPTVYNIGSWSNVYTGLVIPAVSGGTMNVYYVKITDNHGCEYGPYMVDVYCNERNIDPCYGYVDPPVGSQYYGCCEKCNSVITQGQTSDPCYNWCNQWQKCCVVDGGGIDPTLTDDPTLPSNYPCPPTDLNSPWYTYQPVPAPTLWQNAGYPLQEFCDSDWCIDGDGNPILSGPTGSGPHPDCVCCPTFDCFEGQCVENGLGTGFYPSKVACLESTCITPNYKCVQQGAPCQPTTDPVNYIDVFDSQFDCDISCGLRADPNV